MKIADIDFPKPILDALRDDKLVVFAGAGVSMGEPADLPSFSELVRAIARGTGAVLDEGESEDQFLGRLRHRECRCMRGPQKNSQGMPPNLPPSILICCKYSVSRHPLVSLQPILISCSRGPLRNCSIHAPMYSQPLLCPWEADSRGLYTVHGSVDREDEMVLTDSDFGRAYLTEGWARRFLVNLFGAYIPMHIARCSFTLAPESDDP